MVRIRYLSVVGLFCVADRITDGYMSARKKPYDVFVWCSRIRAMVASVIVRVRRLRVMGVRAYAHAFAKKGRGELVYEPSWVVQDFVNRLC